MARGRFISKEICVDKKVNNLSSPWSMLAFTWLLCHADAQGRTYGDPAIVKSLVFPRRDGEITTDQVESFIEEWNDCGLINWYEVNGDKYIEFPNFEKHQIGLRKNREPASIIPARVVNPEGIRKVSGSLPAEVKLSKVEVKGEVEVNGGATISPLQRRIEQLTGVMPTNAADVKALDEIEKIDPDDSDIIGAINWLKDQNVTIYHYKTLVRPIGVQKAMRTQKEIPKNTAYERNKTVFAEILGENYGDS